jgi:hypothetical protein
MTEIVSGIGLCARPFANASRADAQGPHRELATRAGSVIRRTEMSQDRQTQNYKQDIPLVLNIADAKLTQARMGWWAFLVAALSFTYVTNITNVQASIICSRIETLPTVSDPHNREMIENDMKARYGTMPLKVAALNERFYIVRPDDQRCLKMQCYYRLNSLDGNRIAEQFAFRATGWMLISGPQLDGPSDFSDDTYSRIFFEAAKGAYLGIGLPRKERTVTVEAWSGELLKLPTCN